MLRPYRESRVIRTKFKQLTHLYLVECVTYTHYPLADTFKTI